MKLKKFQQLISSILVTAILTNSSLVWAADVKLPQLPPLKDISTAVTNAVCPPSINLGVGDKVTDCPRVGLRADVAKKVQFELIEKDTLTKELSETQAILDSKDAMISNQSQQINLYKADSDRERAAYDAERDRSKTSFWVGMGVGMLSILAGAWAVKQVSR